MAPCHVLPWLWLAGRLGGEECALVLPGTGRDNAMILAERIRQRLADREITVGDQSLSVTVSIGVTALSPADVHQDDALARADAALYAAKRSGRNRVRAVVAD